MGVYKNNNGDLELISGATLWADAPIGCIQAYGAATAPEGWLICNGAAVSRTTYAALFAVIGTSFGAGDGTTTFNIPDLREATVKGVGLTGHSENHYHYGAGGVALGEFLDDRIQTHQHTYKRLTTPGTAVDTAASGSFTNLDNETYDITGARTGATTEVKAVGANWIIKAQQIALPVDIESQVQTVAAAAGEDAAETYIEQKLKGVLEYTLTVGGQWESYTTTHMIARFVDESSGLDYRIPFSSIVQGSAQTYYTIGKTSEGRNINIFRSAIGINTVYVSIEGTSTDYIKCYGCDF